MIMRDGRTPTTSNSTADGTEESIRGGKFISNGKDSPGSSAAARGR